jgi:hypothetical protein
MSLPAPRPENDNVAAEIGSDLHCSLTRHVDDLTRAWRTQLAQFERLLQTTLPPERRADLAALQELSQIAVAAFEQLGSRAVGALDDEDLATVRWEQLTGECIRDGQAGARLWAQVRHLAREELASGRTAGTAVAPYFETSMDRARFLAIRSALADGLTPANGAEWLLIDGMAQAWTLAQHWLGKHTTTESLDAARVEQDLRQRGEWAPPRLSEAEAIDRAALLADRFQRQFLRLMKAYRDQRRVLGQVIVAAGGQLNVGQQQVNVGAVREADAS